MIMKADPEELKPYNVRLPRELCDRLPAAKIRTGKKIQDLVREALEHYVRKLNL